MTKKQEEFIKLEVRLLNDPRFFSLSEFDQLFYIKLLLLLKHFDNQLAKNWNTIGSLMRVKKEQSDPKCVQSDQKKGQSDPKRPQSDRKCVQNDLRVSFKRLKSEFPNLLEHKHFIYLKNFHERTLYRPYQDKDKDKDKEKDKDRENGVSHLTNKVIKNMEEWKKEPRFNGVNK